MADLYIPAEVPGEYDPDFFRVEFMRIAEFLSAQELPNVLLLPQAQAPEKVYTGLVVNANGTDWDPGSGAGLYEYVGGAWNKL